MHPYWPLFDLEVRTPSLTLRYIDDALGIELARMIEAGIHDPEEMPFAIPWATVPSPQREHDSFRHWWRARADSMPDSWTIEFAVIHDGATIGAGGLTATDFPLLRTFETGSWLGRSFQGQGHGKEFRAAMLHLGFAGLAAVEATTAAWSDNPRSLGVTRHWGYEANGITRGKQGDRPGELHKFRMSREQWEAIRRDDIELVNVAPTLDFLGLA